MQSLKIDLLKLTGSKRFTSKDGVEHVAIPLAANNVFVGKKSLSLDLTLMENRDGLDSYGNNGFIVQDIGKDRRLAGEKGPIIGNWRHVGPTPQKPPQDPHNRAKADGYAPQDDDSDPIPF